MPNSKSVRYRPLKRYIWYGFNIVLLLAIACYIGFHKDEYKGFFDSIKDADLFWFGIAFIMIGLNLSIEALKWRLLVRQLLANYRFGWALRSLLKASAIGIFTPNRVGDYLGRLVGIPAPYHPQALSLIVTDRILQAYPTLLMGLVSSTYLCFRLEELIALNILFLRWLLLLFALAVLALGIMVLAWRDFLPLLFALKKSRSDYINKLCCFSFINSSKGGLYWRWFRLGFYRFIMGFGKVSPHILRICLSLALLRYSIFSLQFAFLAYSLGWEHSFTDLYACIGLIFFIKSMLPSFALTEIGVRGAVAIIVMGLFHFPDIQAVQTTLGLYLMNIILPAVVGVLWIDKL